MWCRGIRGATTADSNTAEAVLEATDELLREMIEANGIRPEDVAYTMFTTTSDLDAEFPAVAARNFGWTGVALLCGQEIDVPGSLKGVVRILILVNTEKGADEIAHVYLRGATELRPDASNPR
ncbi:MAG: chorismate mutase [Dehalococcoidia bacterium]